MQASGAVDVVPEKLSTSISYSTTYYLGLHVNLVGKVVLNNDVVAFQHGCLP